MLPGDAGPGERGGGDGRGMRGATAAVTVLAPVRAYLLRAASAEADRIRAAAHAEAGELIRQARLSAERAVRDGEARGRTEAAPVATAERSRGRARARAIVLGAQREAYDELCRRIRAEADGLRDDPRYGLLVDRLTVLATQAAGPDAMVTVVPEGGVLARRTGRGGLLSARLGPHLLGGVFDGPLRPLSGAPAWLEPGYSFGAGSDTEFDFTPEVAAGAAVGEGGSLGTTASAGGIGYRVLVPPGLGGAVGKIREAGPTAVDAVIATVAGTDVRLSSAWPIRRPRPYRERLEAGAPLLTGQRVVDMLFPVTKGGSCAVPGGFGTGKTVLLQQITKWCDADVIVYVGCGERGNELADMLGELSGLSDPRTGGRLLARTVVIANTSNMPMMAREASIYTAAAVAEHFRDMGLDVVVVADSTSRWAEALREFASRNGELPAEEGYPATLASALAAFYERAGRVHTSGGYEGSVTIIGAVSPAGGDMTEPVTTYTQRFVRGLWSLDRDLAYARHYPAVSWSGSFARDADTVAAWRARSGDTGWGRRRSELSALLAEADRLSALAELMGVTALPPRERAAILGGRLVREGVLQQSALSPVDAFCGSARAAALGEAVLAVAGRCRELAAGGVDPAALENQDFSPILRAREEADTAEAVAAREQEMLAALARLSTHSEDGGPA